MSGLFQLMKLSGRNAGKFTNDVARAGATFLQIGVGRVNVFEVNSTP